MPKLASLHLVLLLLPAIASVSSSSLRAQEFDKISVLLIDGQNNHNWKATTPVIVEALERDNLCNVTVSTSPPKKSSQDEWKTWKPNFQNYDVTLTNYNGEMWKLFTG